MVDTTTSISWLRKSTYAGSGAFPELLAIYHLLGDPATGIH